MSNTESSRDTSDPLALFSQPVRAWFAAAFERPTPAQAKAWPVIAGGRHTLLVAPTGSGKTLAAFLWCIDRVAALKEHVAPRDASHTRGGGKNLGVSVLYISPMRALSYDVERNLTAPLVGIADAATRLGASPPELTVAVRTGDTPQQDRRAIQRNPPDILITTPESLYVLLTSRAREILRAVRWVIVDEIHAIAGNKRGAHLALSLERLEALVDASGAGKGGFQRIGLSATQRPLDEIGRFLVGAGRTVEIVDAGARKPLDLRVVVPLDDMAQPGATSDDAGPEGRNSVWPAIYPRLLDLVLDHRSTIIFVNARRLAERIAGRLNDLHRERSQADGGSPTDADLVLAHHGSIAREQRTAIEDALKAGRLRGIVATSSLELGIDMGAVDLVIQVESPKAVARGLQRVGRAGHSIDAVSRARFFPKYRGDLLETAVVVRRMLDGEIESTRALRNPLDVLAQQVVATCALEAWSTDDLFRMLRRAYGFADLSREIFDGVLDMLAGRYPSDDFVELRPRLVWDRTAGTVIARRDARTVAVTSGGTIPDRGLFAVHLGIDGPRIGELDEEMVYESRAGETFLLGATTWRIEQITPQRVIVSPAPGEPAKMPFWKGDGAGRPIELGRAIGAFTREVAALPEDRALRRLQDEHQLDERAARNLIAYIEEQRDATATLPSDRTIVIERFRDELGDWRICVLTPFGERVHAPWAIAIEARLRASRGIDVQPIHSDDGIAIRFPDADEPPDAGDVIIEPEAIEDIVTEQLGGTALFAAHFRENAARALLLPRRRGGARRPLWQMRQRSADLLAVASRYGSFPIILETYRECLQDVFDMPALVEVLQGVASRRINVISVETQTASPFASSLVFNYIAEFMYEGDAPLAEQRAQALSLDRDMLRELLGQEELRELLDPEALAELELDLQRLTGGRKAKDADQLHDLLRRLGDLSPDEIAARSLVRVPAGDTRFQAVRIAGDARYVATEDVARYRDACGVVPPAGIPEAFLGPVEAALDSLLLRYARVHGPFLAAEPAHRWGIAEPRVTEALRRLAAAGEILYGEFRPGGSQREWCDAEVLRSLRRRSLARLRRQVEAVSPEAYARFLPAWQGVGRKRTLVEVLSQLEGAPIVASVLEQDVLRARLASFQPRDLDDLCAAGEAVWVGRGPLGRDDGRVSLYRWEHRLLIPTPSGPPEDPLQRAILDHLERRGASFYREIYAAAGGGRDEPLLEALWSLVWAGLVTNDTLAPLRALRLKRGSKRSRRPPALTRLGPPEAVGRWSLVGTLVEAAAATQRSLAQAQLLLDRYGVVTREVVAAEGVPGGFAALYPVLRAMEESGKVRRGYFVEGLGGAQFALPGAVERLRAEREPPDAPRVVRLAATDPANPYGVALPWNGRRVAGAHVVLADGVPALFLERGGALTTLAAFEDPEVVRLAIAALGPTTIERIDGEPVLRSPHLALLTALGFERDYLAMTLRPGVEAPARGRR